MMKKLFILLTLLATSVAGAWADVTTATQFKSAFEAGGTVTLGGDITDNTDWDDPMAALYTANADVTINLNGHTLTFSGTASGWNGALGLNGHTVTLTGSGTIDVTNIGDAYVFFKDDEGGTISITPGDGNTIKVKTEKAVSAFYTTYGIGFDASSFNSIYTSDLSTNTTDYDYSYDSDAFYVVKSKKTAAITVAMIGDTPYTTLQAALNAVTSGQTIDMAADVETSSADQSALYTAPATTFTLNMNGHTISNTNLQSFVSYSGTSSLFSVPAGSNMTITGEGVLKDTYHSSSNGSSIADVAGSLTFENCDDLEVSCSSDNVFTGSGTISITSGKYNKSVESYVTSPAEGAWDDNNEWYIVYSYEAMVGDEKYESLWNAITYVGYGLAEGDIKMLKDVTLTSDCHQGQMYVGGKYYYTTISLNGNMTLDLNGHTLQMPDAYIGVSGGYGSTPNKLTIKDSSTDKTGIFLFGTNTTRIFGNCLSLEGGTFNENITNYCAEGYKATKLSDTEYKVVLIPVCNIGSVEYGSLLAAVQAAKSGETIELNKDNDEDVTLPAGVTVHLNSHSHGTFSVDDVTCVLITSTEDYVSARLRAEGDAGNMASTTVSGTTYYYNSLQAAISAAETNGTVNLLADNTEAIKLPVGMTVNLNGHTHSLAASAGYVLVETTDNVTSRLRTADDEGNIATVLDGSTTYYCTTFEDALELANATSGATVTLLADYAYPTNGTGLWNVTSSMTIDGNGHTLSGYGSLGTSKAATTLAINEGGTNTVEVTLKNLTINNTATGTGRTLEACAHVSKLNVEGCTINAVGSGNNQGITISGTNAESEVEVNITNSTIVNQNNSTLNGYGIITFAPVKMTLDKTTVKAWSALYFKGEYDSSNTSGSTVDIKGGSYLEGYNAQTSGINNFGTIVCEDDNITVNAYESAIIAESASSNVTNSIFCNSYITGSEDNTFNIYKDCKITLKNISKYFVVDDAESSNAIVNLMESSLYNFIPTNADVYYTNKSKASHIACEEGTGVFNNTHVETMTDWPWIISKIIPESGNVIICHPDGTNASSTTETTTPDAWNTHREASGQENDILIVPSASSTDYTNITNVIVATKDESTGAVSYDCKNLTITDRRTDNGNPLNMTYPVPFKAHNAYFNRKLGTAALSSKWGTICLPYPPTDTDDHTYYKLAGAVTADGSITLSFSRVDNPEANTPYLFRAKTIGDDGTVNFTMNVPDGKTVTEPDPSIGGGEVEGGYELVGLMKSTSVIDGTTFTEKNSLCTECITDANAYYLDENDDNCFHKINGRFNSYPFRCYLKPTADACGEARQFTVNFDDLGETTGVKFIESEDGNTVKVIYDLSGRQQKEMQKGINIVNGKKVLK